VLPRSPKRNGRAPISAIKACRGMEVQLHVSVIDMSNGASVVDVLITVGRSVSLVVRCFAEGLQQALCYITVACKEASCQFCMHRKASMLAYEAYIDGCVWTL